VWVRLFALHSFLRGVVGDQSASAEGETVVSLDAHIRFISVYIYIYKYVINRHLVRKKR
jgi:hypothetical protein